MLRLKLAAVLTLIAALTGCAGVTESVSNTTPSVPSTPVSQTPPPPSGGTPLVPASAKLFPAIQNMQDWDSCSGSCSGEPGTNATYSMQQGVSTPSASGSSTRFSIDGGTSWATTLWWKQLGSNDSATHFVYEMQIYLDNPSAAQALEFSVNQNTGGFRYEYAMQCDIRGSHKWRVWNPAIKGWSASTQPCAAPAANQWNKLMWEFERTVDHKVHIIAVTANGQRYPIDMLMDSVPVTTSGLNVAFQMDSDVVPTPWSTWVDDVKLSAW